MCNKVLLLCLYMLQETLCFLEAMYPQSMVCWKSIQRSGLHFINAKNSAFLLQQRRQEKSTVKVNYS